MNNYSVARFSPSFSIFPSLFDRYFAGDFLKKDFEPSFVPAINVKEKNKEYIVEIAAAGFSKEDFSIEIKDKNLINVSARKEKSTEEKDPDEKIIRKEFFSSSFEKSFRLPENTNSDRIEAKYKNGILKITVPKIKELPENKVKQIEIQ